MMKRIGIIGMGVMGRSLAINFASKNIPVAIYNRTVSKAQEVQEQHPQLDLLLCDSISKLVASLEKPRVILLMVSAGNATQMVMDELLLALEPHDLVIDGGNAYFKDTEKRMQQCSLKEIEYLGMGVSGGEKGALYGPCMMVGGAKTTYDQVAAYLETIAAKYDKQPCVAYIGQGGAGHFLKMVHNGMEYAIMELIAELITLYRVYFQLDEEALIQAIETLNQGLRQSFLLDITLQVLKQKDQQGYVWHRIVNDVDQKGTGKWMCQEAFELQFNLSLIEMAVNVRNDSEQRQKAEIQKNANPSFSIDALTSVYQWVLDLIFHQSITFLQAAAIHYGYDFHFETIGTIFRSGCIIQGAIFEELRQLYEHLDDRASYLEQPTIKQRVTLGYPVAKQCVVDLIKDDVYCPLINQALLYYQGMHDQTLQTKMIAAQRDLFGAHTLLMQGEREHVHIEWDE